MGKNCVNTIERSSVSTCGKYGIDTYRIFTVRNKELELPKRLEYRKLFRCHCPIPKALRRTLSYSLTIRRSTLTSWVTESRSSIGAWLLVTGCTLGDKPT